MLTLLAESWTWWSFGTLIVVFRYVSRRLQLGSFKALQAEDYLMLLVFAFYTCLIVFMNIVAHLDTNLMLPSDIPLLTPASITSRIHGSKLVLVVEQCMIMTQWGCKCCLLLLYNKITIGLRRQWAVKVVGAYVLVNWIVMESLYFGYWCRPLPQYWAVPVANVQCSAALNHLITNAVFNITSDIMMLCIPLPLLIASQLPRANKLILCCLFGLGIFVILCAVLNKYYSFAHPFSPMWTFWYIREASTALYVANMPMCWSLVRRIFKLRAFNGLSSSNGARTRSKSIPIATSYSSAGIGSRLGVMSKTGNGNTFTLSRKQRMNGGNSRSSWWDREAGLSRTESEVHIVGANVPLEILTKREVEVDIDQQGVRTPGGVRVHKLVQQQSGGKMLDGSGMAYETRTTISTIPMGRKSESESGSR